MARPGDSEKERRVPVQARSRRRYDAILDAAATLFAEAGFEATTVEGIAERAETSIGSVYQFFPNKTALFDAVAERTLERSREAFDALFATVPDDVPWPTLIDGAVDAFAALHGSDPAFRAVVVNFALYPVYQERDDALTRAMIERLAQLLETRAPHLPERRPRLLATVIVQTFASTMFVSSRSAPSLRGAMREELKTLVRRYLEPELEPPPPARRRPLRRP
ncbi:TetR family transcriptional regulator [Sandaracinus amylolyticus]|nr:TetR family transcriptional regulator [Sandaracinus amylolyticus]